MREAVYLILSLAGLKQFKGCQDACHCNRSDCAEPHSKAKVRNATSEDLARQDDIRLHDSEGRCRACENEHRPLHHVTIAEGENRLGPEYRDGRPDGSPAKRQSEIRVLYACEQFGIIEIVDNLPDAVHRNFTD